MSAGCEGYYRSPQRQVSGKAGPGPAAAILPCILLGGEKSWHPKRDLAGFQTPRDMAGTPRAAGPMARVSPHSPLLLNHPPHQNAVVRIQPAAGEEADGNRAVDDVKRP